MNNDIIGIRQLVLMKKGSFASPQYPVAMGLGDEAYIEMPEEAIKGYLNEDLPDTMNFKIVFKSYQYNYYTIGRLIQVFCVDGGVDAQAVLEKTSATTYGGVYNFSGNNFLGFEFEWRMGMKNRYFIATAEVSLPLAEAKLLIQSSLVNTPFNLTAAPFNMNHRGMDFDNFKTPYYGKIESPTGTVLVNGEEISDRDVVLKSVVSKLQFNRSKVNWINIMVSLTTKRTSAQEFLNYLNMTRNAELRIEEKFSPTAKETLLFGAGVLYRKHEKRISKDEGYIKLSYEKNLPIYDIVIDGPTSVLSVSMTV